MIDPGIAEMLLKAPFQFAKSMPDEPHEYTLRKQWENEREFEACVQYIHDNGYRTKYKKAYYTKWNLNGQMYWSMGWPARQTTVLNRAVIYAASDYDAIAKD